jgi:4'-phosphopantetheinyl transferase
MEVYWLEQTEADVPEESDWLTHAELIFLSRLRFAPRRAAWRLGRWTAKRALAAYLDYEGSPSTLARIEIRPASSGAPEVFFDNKPAPLAISLSHRHGRAFCALAPRVAAQLGCDVELIEAHSEAFVRDYFTAEEQALVARQPTANRQWLPVLLWSAKESALKALHEGLRLDTRSVIVNPTNVSPGPPSWRPLEVRYTGGHLFHGWWQADGQMVRTIVSVPPPNRPIPLNVTHRVSSIPAASEPQPLEI